MSQTFPKLLVGSSTLPSPTTSFNGVAFHLQKSSLGWYPF
jgi:hypothetical protein